jgi:DNA repair photolyase
MDAGGKLLMIGKGVTYRELPCATALNRCDSQRMPFDWTINPYRGCEFGCRYCYARYTHGFMGLPDTRLFETEIFAKLDAASALTRDLRRASRRAAPLGGIALGTATDPYQPAERKLLVTRRLLEVFASDRAPRGLRLSLTTKSALVTRDIDLLTAIGRRHRLSVNMTITTLNRRLARILEPRAPRPARRLLALRELARAKITTGVFIMPVIPEITDAPASLEAIVSAAARAGAAYAVHQVLFLMSSATKEFYPFLRRNFPRLLPRYRRVYGASAYHTDEYRKRIDDLVESLRRRHGLAARPPAACDLEAEPPSPAQLSLGF